MIYIKKRGSSVVTPIDKTSQQKPQYSFKSTSAIKERRDILRYAVKSTTSDSADTILMARNEVHLHKQEKSQTCLIIVSLIQLTEHAGKFMIRIGHVEAWMGWAIDEWAHEPTAFRLSRM